MPPIRGYARARKLLRPLLLGEPAPSGHVFLLLLARENSWLGQTVRIQPTRQRRHPGDQRGHASRRRGSTPPGQRNRDETVQAYLQRLRGKADSPAHGHLIELSCSVFLLLDHWMCKTYLTVCKRCFTVLVHANHSLTPQRIPSQKRPLSRPARRKTWGYSPDDQRDRAKQVSTKSFSRLRMREIFSYHDRSIIHL